MAFTRRAFAAATAAGVVAPTVARAKECPAAAMDWMTMSLEARNLAYFNVAHVGADFARQKTEGWAAASKDLREQRPKHLEVETLSPMRRPSVNKPLSIAYGTGELPAMVATSRDYHAYRSEFSSPRQSDPDRKSKSLHDPG